MIETARMTRFAALAMLTGACLSAHAANAPKVDICHVTPKKPPNVISVSENALPAHLAHGDGVVGVDVDEFCEPLALTYCVLGLFPPYDDELHQIEYSPSTGEVIGEGFTYAGPLVGLITPAGPPESSIFAAGSVYQFVLQYSGLEEYQWSSSATSADDTGVFSGTWQYDPVAIVENDGPAEYYFFEGECHCDIPGYAGYCPEE